MLTLRVKKLSVAIVLLLFVVGLQFAAPRLAQSNSYPALNDYATWTTLWWQWALTEPFDTNPLFDTTGANAGYNQQGPVWFLVGYAGQSQAITRTIVTPLNKYLFFPIVNNAIFNGPDLGVINPEEVDRASLAASIDSFVNIQCELDGVKVVLNPATPIVRTQSPPFMVHLYPNNLFGVPESDNEPCYTDGYWVMLSPLSPGKHTLHFFAIDSTDSKNFQDITYTFTPLPSTLLLLGTGVLGLLGFGMRKPN